MRKFRYGSSHSQRYLKSVPKGVCNLCGGKGRYKETFTYKNPVIHHCWKCKGTGSVKLLVKYIGETDMSKGLWKDRRYEVISESDSDYVVNARSDELLQIRKELFEVVD